MIDGANYKVDGLYGSHDVLVIANGDQIIVADLEGEILIEHTRAAPEITYVGNGGPRGRRPTTPEPSPKS